MQARDVDQLDRIEAAVEQLHEVLRLGIGVRARRSAFRHERAKVPVEGITASEVERGVEDELRAIALRHQLLPEVLHHQVTWTMILEAYRHTVVLRRPLAVTDFHSLAYTPEATSLRHIGLLVDAGLLKSEQDLNDRRRRFLSLSDKGRKLLVRYFTELRS